MTNFETARPLPLGAITTYRVVSFFDNAIEAVRSMRSTYATAHALNGLTDYQLEDIGLCRGDIASTSKLASAQH